MGEKVQICMSDIKLTGPFKARSHRLCHFDVYTYFQSQCRYTPVGYTGHQLDQMDKSQPCDSH